jgi:NAD(P)-dependent dehydrogenase (short-subunit alcohol dehydrogenase family)
METTTRTALVTGANRGLGLETCRQLARHGLRVVLTSREDASGLAAAELLAREGLQVLHQRLDVTLADDVARVADLVTRELGRLDVLVNNAGVLFDRSRPDDPDATSVFKARVDTLRDSMEVNLYGALRLCQAFVPAMVRRGYGRVVNVSTGMAQLTEMNGRWPGYRTSKAALNALTRIVADEVQGRGVLVNSACPGWVRTDMGGPRAPRGVEEGADTIVWLATLPDDGPSGGFFRDRQQIAW